MEELLLIDAHALIHRFFHALPPLTTPSHEPIGAVYGLSVMLLKILHERKPAYAAAAFDRPEKTFRALQFENYKIHRPPAPDALISQFGRAREVFRHFRVPLFEKPSYEADDVIGTLATRFGEKSHLKIVILSGDMDLLQLVRDDRVVVEMIKRGISETNTYDEPAWIEKYGFVPQQLTAYKGLAGDTSDNIPGVKGIGPKAATELLKEFGSISEIYENIGLIKPAFAKKLEEHRADALLSKELATIKIDVPLEPISLDQLKIQPIDTVALSSFFTTLGFTSLVRRLAENT